MSSKSTMILTSDNEHWYHDCLANYYHGIDTESDGCFVLEFSKEHILDLCEGDDSFEIIVKPESELGKALREKFGR